MSKRDDDLQQAASGIGKALSGLWSWVFWSLVASLLIAVGIVVVVLMMLPSRC